MAILLCCPFVNSTSKIVIGSAVFLLSPCYFTGTIEIEGREGESLRLTASLILYRRRPDKRNNHEQHDTICNVSAVWWDFFCEDEEGVICDDFDFEKLTSFLIEEE